MKWLVVLSCLLWQSTFSLYADPVVDNQSPEKKYALSVCAFFKNEARYIREWIEYHRLVGVDHFYLYDNGSRDRSVKILEPYIRAGLVTLVYWPDRVRSDDEAEICNWVLSTQLPAYENAVKYRCFNRTQWLVMLDIDEFLVPIEAKTIPEVLENYGEFSSLELTSDDFDASYVDVVPKRELLINTLELIGKPAQNIQKSVEKTIFRPDRQVCFTWPPYKCHFKPGGVEGKLSRAKLRINKYVGRHHGVLQFGKMREKLRVDNRVLTESQIKDLLECGFEIEDHERAIHRFESQLRKKLGLETGWNW